MKKAYNVQIKKSDGSFVQKGVLAGNSASEPAIVVAIRAAIAAVGADSEVVSINVSSTVDIDATTVA